MCHKKKKNDLVMNTRTVYSVNIYNTIQYIYYTNTEKYDSLLYYVLNNKSNYFKQ